LQKNLALKKLLITASRTGVIHKRQND